jgi:hypothetical protein
LKILTSAEIRARGKGIDGKIITPFPLFSILLRDQSEHPPALYGNA